MTSKRLSELTWPALDRGARSVLAVPLGSTEQHGPHLPLSTDTDIAIALCERLAASRDDIRIGPAVPYGSSGEHAAFPGTVSIGQEALEQLVIQLVRSAVASFDGVIFVCGHGGNAAGLLRASQQMRDERHRVLAFLPRWEGDAHAGRTETSMMLALRPDAVRLEVATAGNNDALADLLPRLRAEGVRAVSETGVLGDPSGASAAEGEALLGAATDQLIAEVARWRS